MVSWEVVLAKTVFTDNINGMFKEVEKTTKDFGFLEVGDRVVIIGGVLINKPGSTNFINVKEVE